MAILHFLFLISVGAGDARTTPPDSTRLRPKAEKTLAASGIEVSLHIAGTGGWQSFVLEPRPGETVRSCLLEWEEKLRHLQRPVTIWVIRRVNASMSLAVVTGSQRPLESAAANFQLRAADQVFVSRFVPLDFRIEFGP